MTTPDLETLIIEESKESIYDFSLGVAQALGLPVTTWQAGDPTRSLYHVQAEKLAALEAIVSGYIRSGFLDYASGTWLKVRADQDFGVTVPSATYATTDVVLTNASGFLYDSDDIAPGKLTFKNSTTDKTYRNTTGGTLAPGGTLTVTVEADESGSDSSAAAGEIDEMVTTLLGVTCTNPTAAVGTDEQDEATTREQCRNARGAMSPNGPAAAYAYVALNQELTGTSGVTKVRVYDDSDTGDVTVYLAGSSGAVAEADRALVEEAILQWATPLCITPTVLSATAVPVAVTYSLWLYKSANKTVAEVEEEVEAALEQAFAARPIGGDVIAPSTTGYLYRSLIESKIRSVYDASAFRVVVSAPVSDQSLGNGDIATLGTVTATVYIVEDP